MTREDAIKIIQNEYKCVDRECDIDKSCSKCDLFTPTKELLLQAYKMAIEALENIGHLTNRPCSVCEFHKENGCCKWDCVFKEV